MELVSYHYDHKSGKSILGNQYLQLGFHNGANFYPLDMAMIASKNRPNNNMKSMDKRTNGWRRRKEALSKKTDVLISMVQRVWDAGIDASFLLFDSWYAHDDVIHRVCDCGYGVICRLKRGRVKYEYQGEKYTLKQFLNGFSYKTVVKNNQPSPLFVVHKLESTEITTEMTNNFFKNMPIKGKTRALNKYILQNNEDV